MLYLQISLIVLVATVVTMEYAFILKTWRRPFDGYRILLGTVLVVTFFSEIERVFGDGFLAPMSRAVVLAISTNFLIFEQVMFLKRRALNRQRRVYVENALIEDLAMNVHIIEDDVVVDLTQDSQDDIDLMDLNMDDIDFDFDVFSEFDDVLDVKVDIDLTSSEHDALYESILQGECYLEAVRGEDEDGGMCYTLRTT